jgi:hypothetical protein
MKTRQPKSWRPVYLLLGACSFFYLLLLFYIDPSRGLSYFSRTSHHYQHGLQPPGDLFSSLGLTTEQCDTTFPLLTKDIRETVALGPFDLKPAGNGGLLQVRILNGQARFLLSSVVAVAQLYHRPPTNSECTFSCSSTNPYRRISCLPNFLT